MTRILPFLTVLLFSACGMSSRVPSKQILAGKYVNESFFVTQFDPPSGTVAALPAIVNISFSQAELDPVTVNALTHFNTICDGQTYAAGAVNYSSGSIIVGVTLPVITGLVPGSNCQLLVSSNVTDASGVSLTGNRYVTYRLQ